MTKKERLKNVIRGKKIDKIPWTIYKSYPPWGETEAKFRSKGLALIYQHFPIVKVILPDIVVSEHSKYIINGNRGKEIIIRTFKTPFGEISAQHEFIVDSLPLPGDLIQKFGSEIDMESLSWVTRFPFNSEMDYEVLEYIYENAEFHPNYEEFIFTEKIIGSDGYIMANIGKSPFQIILYELMGAENCYLELNSNPKKIKSIFDVLYKHQKNKCIIAAESPAEVIWVPDNLTSGLTPPYMFEEYYIPFYNEMSDILHKKGKKLAVHMDGTLKSLVDLIGKTDIDIIEAFTPSPMCDLSIREARAAWVDKIIWVNFPGVLLAAADPNTIEEYTRDMLRSVAPGDNFIIGCTESFPMERWEIAFGAIDLALKKYGDYPIDLK